MRVPGTPHEVRKEVLESLKKSAPHRFEDPSEKAQAAAEVDAEVTSVNVV